MVEERATELDDRQSENMEERATKKAKLENSGGENSDVGSELKQKISKQIEYYFSDVNLVKDKFMQEQLKKNDNCLKLSVLTTFARLAQLTKDEDIIVKALKDLPSDLLEVDEDKKQIRRKLPLPNREEYQKELDTRTVHISGFPDFIKFDDLHRFCSKFGEIESLSMRQHFKTKQFKGCIHVVYKKQEDAQKIIDGPELTFKDRELRRESMGEYHERKERIKKHRIQKRKNKNKGDSNPSDDDDEEEEQKDKDSAEASNEQEKKDTAEAAEGKVDKDTVEANDEQKDEALTADAGDQAKKEPVAE